MTRSALQQLASLDNLTTAWNHMLANTSSAKRRSAGIDGVSLIDFQAQLNFHVRNLAHDLKTKSYEPQPLAPHFVPKTNGKDRVICIPSVRDRLVQRALGRQLHQRGYDLTNPISYGFVKNRSVKKAANLAVAYRNRWPWAYKADISSFFDSIDRNMLIQKIQQHIRLKSLHPLLIDIVNTEIFSTSSSVAKKIKALGIKKGLGLRQGMPISPYLANLMLIDFDAALSKKRIPAVRYADDLIAFGSCRSEVEDIHDLCFELLKKERLSIHPLEDGTKTVIADPNETIDFLGLGLAPICDKYELIVTNQQLKAIHTKLMALSDMNRCLEQGITLSIFIQKLEGKISGFRGAYDLCSNHEQLEHYLNFSRNKTVKTILHGLGINYSALTEKQRSFLEIA